MRKTILSVAALLSSWVANAQWTAQVSGVSQTLNGVSFLNKDTGIVVGDNMTAIKTTDGGLHWNAVAVGAGHNYYSVAYTSADTIYICGGGVGFIGYCCGFIRRSTDGGTTWTEVYNSPSPVNKLYFLNSKEGYAVAGETNAGILIRTLNGGASWTEVHNTTMANLTTLNSVFALDTSLVAAVGYDDMTANPLAWKYHAGAVTTMATGIAQTWNDVWMKSPTNYFVVGYGSHVGKMAKTTDGGTSWTTVTTPFTEEIMGIQFVDNDTAFAVCDMGKVLKSTDAGTTWTSTTTPGAKHLRGLNFPAKNLGYVVGDEGTVIKYYIPLPTIDTSDTTTSLQDPRLYADYTIFPSPSNSTLTVKPGNNLVYDVVMSNVSGQVVYQAKQLNQQHTIPVTNLPSGIYYLKIQNREMITTKKVEVLH